MSGSPRNTLPRWMSVRVVVWASTALAVLIWVAAVAFVGLQRDALEDRARDRVTLDVRVMDDHAARTLNAVDVVLDAAAGRQTPIDGLPEWARAQATTLQTLPFVRSLSRLDADGRVVASTRLANVGVALGAVLPSHGAPPPNGLRPRLWPGRDVSDLRPDAMAVGSSQFMLMLRALPAGGWLVATLNPDYFANQHALNLAQPERSGALVSWDGLLLTATPSLRREPGSHLGTHAIFHDWLPHRERGDWVGPGLDGEPSVQAFRAVRGQPLLVWAAESHSQVLAPLRAFAVNVGLAALALSLSLLVMAAAAVRSLRGHAQVSQALAEADARVVRSERSLRTLIEGVHEWLFRTDVEGRLTYVNPRWREFSGWGDEHALGQTLSELVTPECRDRVRAAEQAAAAGREQHLHVCLARARGEPLSVEVSLSPLQDEQGRALGCAGFAVDVTEREAARAHLQGQLDFNAQLLAATPVPLFVQGLAGELLSVNQAWEDLLAQGLPAAALLEGPLGKTTGPEQAEPAPSGPGWLWRTEMRLTPSGGAGRDLVVSRVAFTGADRQPAGVIGSVVDVTEFREAERATRLARDAAESANHLKTEFLANITHELRTPLQSIIGFSELGVARAREHPRLVDMFGRIHDGGLRMLALVNDLLDVSRVESRQADAARGPEDFRQALEQVLTAVAEPAAVRQTQLVASGLPVGMAWVTAEPKRLQQVIRIVVLNALKYGPAGGRVECHLAAVEGGFRLEVSDRGPGVPEAEREAIFQPFVQSSRTRDGSGGIGLGLSIARRILQVLGGHIQLAPREGGGSVFSVFLPAAGQGARAPDAAA